MTKIPKMSDLTGKADLGGMFDKVKDMVNAGLETLDMNEEIPIDVDKNDPVAVTKAEITQLLSQLEMLKHQESKIVSQLDKKVKEIYNYLPKPEAPPKPVKEAKVEKKAEPKAEISEPEVKEAAPAAETPEPEDSGEKDNS